MFYEELKSEIEKLCVEKKYDQALVLINSELQMPYVPQDFEQYLITLKKEISLHLIDTKHQKQYDLNEIVGLLHDEQDLVSQALAIKALEHINARAILKEIEQYLMNLNMPDENKTLILFALYSQQIDQELKMQKHNGSYLIKPTELKIQAFNEDFDNVAMTIEQIIGVENPSISQIACSSALIYMLVNFPAPHQVSLNNLTAAMILQAYHFLGLELSYEQLQTMITFDVEVVKLILGGKNE
ncbi:DUF3196 family protein [Williamsoniiplasma lucivorax]|uniref:Uncharacterized protein n=1 Tax=Williamsoniiplasma lucivorax TaxID=209274 RepID=A0A2S5RD13_9MOLU|nr:DUF3196 family protein [Williamsoniiplasma lucivorax]PPE05231.1 hypothetical protein ELUCI_v1c07670 [Williamsoniiplasma lucivorax]